MTPSAEPPGQPSRDSTVVPPPLTVATSLTAVEAVALVLYGLSLLPTLEGQRLVMGSTTVVFFLGYGGFLGFAAWQMYRLRSWARAPIVLAQLIQVMVGVSFWGGGTTPVAVLLVLVGVVVLAGVFHPDSLTALDGDS